MKPISKFDYYFGGWILLIRYKIANFIIGYNIEEALEEHLEVGWDEGYNDATFDIKIGTGPARTKINPYRQGEEQ